MNVFVEFELDNVQVQKQLEGLGYQVVPGEKSAKLRKNTQLKSVINELVPIVEKAGLNAWELNLKEYERDSSKLIAEYSDGRIKNYS